MKLEEALKKIAELESVITDQNKAIKVQNEELENQNKAIKVQNEELKNQNKEIEGLKFEIEKQNIIIFKQQKKLNELLGEKEVIREKYNIERTKSFLRKSEKINKIVINEPEEVIKEEKKKTGRKLGGRNFANIDLETCVCETIYEDPDTLMCDKCNDDLVIASQKQRYIVEVIPSTIKVTKVIKRSYKCPNCNKQDNKIYYPINNSIFPGSILTPSLAAYITYCKYELGIPFHHLERHLSNYLKADISKQLLSSWVMNIGDKLLPLFDKMKDDLKHNAVNVIHADETTLVVSKHSLENKDRKKSYVYVYTSSYYTNQIQIYDFQESRAIDKTAKWLHDYEGYIVCDDYVGYSKLTKDNSNIRLQRCWAHARRRFVEILKNIPKAEQSKTTSYKILTLINQLFHLESEYKKRNLIPSLIVKARKQEHKPILDKLHDLIFNNNIKPDSALKSAIGYVKKIWDELLTYLDYGYLEISNNIAERAVKPFVINRKVFMTSGSYAGAKYTTVLFSIIRTALINNLDIQRYLIHLLQNINIMKIDELLPYYGKLPKDLFSS